MRSLPARGMHRLAAVAVASSIALPATAWAAPPMPVAAFQEPMDKARELYTEGESLYSAADYNGAIEKFTEALKIVSKHGSVDDAQVRGLIMFNIAKAHIEAYEVDRDASHLRQARSIYNRFVTEGQAAGYAQADLDDAQSEIDKLDQRIAEIEEEEKKRGAPPPTADGGNQGGSSVDTDKLDQAQKAFGIGIGLTVGGVVLMGGSAAAMGYGATVDKYIKQEINKQRKDDGLPPLSETDPKTDAEKNFEEQEKLKGNIWLAVGVVGIVGGAAMVGVGGWQISKSKKLKAESMTLVPMVDPDTRTGGLVFSGRF